MTPPTAASARPLAAAVAPPAERPVAAGPRPGRAIGYVLKAFPVVSETFILNEVRALEKLGVPLVLMSLKRPASPVVHRAVGELSSPVLYGSGPSRLPALAAAHLRLAARRPRVWAALAWRLVGSELRRTLVRPTAGRRRRLVKRLRRFAWAGWLAHEARKRGIRHLHAHYCDEPLRVTHLAAKLAGIGHSCAAHAKDLYTSPEPRLRRLLAAVRFAVACHGHGEARLRRLLGDAGGRVVRVPHGLDTRLFHAGGGRREPGLILAVGRLTAKKGFDVLLRACALLAAEGRDFRCEIRGEGALAGELAELVARLGLGRQVEIAGFVPQEELPELYRRAAVFTMPCRELADGNRDGVPNVLLEAMACGAPVVASRAAGVPEAVRHGATGLLVPPEDPAALARALARLLDRPWLADCLGGAAAASVAELDYRRTNEALARRFAPLWAAPAAEALDRAEKRAWAPRGMARKARKRLGRAPRRVPGVEAAIRRAIQPGVAANAWRPDLERLATRRLWDEVLKSRRVPGLLEALGAGAGESAPLLDLGCGRGGLAVALAARGLPVVALDLRFRNCAVTGWRGRRYGLSLPSITAVGERLPFADASFSAVCALEVLEHVADPVALLRDIRRVLEPGGACALTVINRWAHLDPHYHLWGINFVPRSWARRYIALRRRTKRSYRDCQTLDEMHYYSFRAFRRLAGELGFRLEDPDRPAAPAARWLHDAARWTSLGFNSTLLVLRRT